jgi:hypothetical protein
LDFLVAVLASLQVWQVHLVSPTLGFDAAATSTLLAKFVPLLASELLAGEGELQASSWEAGSRVSGYGREHELALELTNYSS